jgi:hypothetical protein
MVLKCKVGFLAANHIERGFQDIIEALLRGFCFFDVLVVNRHPWSVFVHLFSASRAGHLFSINKNCGGLANHLIPKV